MVLLVEKMVITTNDQNYSENQQNRSTLSEALKQCEAPFAAVTSVCGSDLACDSYRPGVHALQALQ